MEKMKKYLVVIGGILNALCLGITYSWSVFAKELNTAYGFSMTETQIIFATILAAFAFIGFPIGGNLIKKWGPKKPCLLGTVLLGLSYSLAFFFPHFAYSFWWLLLTVGIMGGLGIGLAYGCPIDAGIKWFPEKAGLISGLMVAGFGLGSLFVAKISGEWGKLIADFGLPFVFQFWGIVILLLGGLGALFIAYPKDYCNKKIENNIPEIKIWKDIRFWVVWFAFIMAAAPGLMVIGILKPLGDYYKLTTIAITAIGVLAIFNAIGRIFWGYISDKIGRHKAMILVFCLQSLMMFIALQIIFSPFGFVLLAAWSGLMFGANFSLFPAIAKDIWGKENFGKNYAKIFTAYGIAGIFGPIIAGRIFDLTGNYAFAFIPVGFSALIAAGLIFYIYKIYKIKN